MNLQDAANASQVILTSLAVAHFHRQLLPASIAETAAAGKGSGPNRHSRMEANAFVLLAAGLCSYLLKKPAVFGLGVAYIAISEVAYKAATEVGE
jgi:hypothetical protein